MIDGWDDESWLAKVVIFATMVALATWDCLVWVLMSPFRLAKALIGWLFK